MRDRLIELCDKKIDTMKFQNSDHWWDFTEKIKEIADYLIANGVTVGDANNATTTWRPASEPPKENGRYLVLHGNDKTNYQAVRYFTNNLKSIYKLNPSFIKRDRAGWYGRVGEMGICEDTSVTHWMPLPQPPKEVE